MTRYLNDWALYVMLGMMNPLNKATWMDAPIYECVQSSIIPMEKRGCIQILGPSATPIFEPATVTFILTDRMKMNAFVDKYLQEYQKDALVIPTECTYYSYKNSISETLKILRGYSQINNKECTIRPIFQDGDRQLKVNQKTRFYEDLLLLHRKGFIELGHVSKDLFPSNTPVREQLKTLSLSIHLRFLTSVDYMEKMLTTSQSYLGLSVSEDNEVYFEGKRILQFTSSAK